MNELDFKLTIEHLRETGFETIPETLRITIPNAKELLQRGIGCFVGNKSVRWLPEYDNIANWLTDNNGKGLLCVGDCGRGKSLICRKILPVVLNHYYHKIVSCFDATELNDKNKTDEILNTHLLCIDDIGTEGESVKFGERRIVFCELADKAEKEGKLLLLTTNLAEDELSKKYGARTVDRLKAITKKVVFKGCSLRG